MASSPRRTSMPLATSADDAASTPVIPSVHSVVRVTIGRTASLVRRALLYRQPLLAADRQHLQDRRRGLLDRAAGDVDGRPFAPRIEPPRVLDLALHLLHVGVFGLGLLLQQPQPVHA